MPLAFHSTLAFHRHSCPPDGAKTNKLDTLNPPSILDKHPLGLTTNPDTPKHLMFYKPQANSYCRYK